MQDAPGFSTGAADIKAWEVVAGVGAKGWNCAWSTREKKERTPLEICTWNESLFLSYVQQWPAPGFLEELSGLGGLKCEVSLFLLFILSWVYLPAKQLSQWAAKDRSWSRITHTPSDKWSLFAVFLSLADCLQNYSSWPDGTQITEVRHSPTPWEGNSLGQLSQVSNKNEKKNCITYCYLHWPFAF